MQLNNATKNKYYICNVFKGQQNFVKEEHQFLQGFLETSEHYFKDTNDNEITLLDMLLNLEI